MLTAKWGYTMKLGNSSLLVGLVLTLSGCSVGVKSTAGMKVYSSGNYQKAVPLLEAEVQRGDVSARYSLGLAYRDGNGVARDPMKADVLLTGAAINGDPRAVAEIRKMLSAERRCPKDQELHDLWGSLALHRNLVYGTYELNQAPPRTLLKMAAIYESPCQGRPIQTAAARSLRALASGPRQAWIYVPH